ncbi:hypothetical protein CHELA41_24476 [Hyphomicrobiales bacterium]|nr:hypothetical protein CHELA41_24476 [Hyphomicrobiales bacterium]
MARAGRKRKPAVSRYKNGKTKERTQVQRDVDAKRVVIEQRLKLVSSKDVLDPLVSTPMGVYLIRGQITEDEFRAGERYATLVYRVRRDYGAPSPDARSSYPAEYVGGGGGGYDEPLPETDDEFQAARRAKIDRRNEYNAAFEALQDAGRAANRSVNRVAVNGRFIDDNDLSTSVSTLKRGLAALAQHLGYTSLDRVRKSA